MAQAGGQIQTDLLGTEARRGDDMAQFFHMLGFQAGLLPQFAHGAVQGILVCGVQLTGGNFPGQHIVDHPVLSHQIDVLLVVYRNDGCRSLVVNDLPQGGAAVWQAHLHMAQVDQGSPEYGFIADRRFDQLTVVGQHECSPP